MNEIRNLMLKFSYLLLDQLLKEYCLKCLIFYFSFCCHLIPKQIFMDLDSQTLIFSNLHVIQSLHRGNSDHKLGKYSNINICQITDFFSCMPLAQQNEIIENAIVKLEQGLAWHKFSDSATKVLRIQKRN